MGALGTVGNTVLYMLLCLTGFNNEVMLIMASIFMNEVCPFVKMQTVSSPRSSSSYSSIGPLSQYSLELCMLRFDQTHE